MTIEEWAKDFKSYVNTLDMQRDDYKSIMEYIDDTVTLLKEQEPVKPNLDVDEWICGNCCHKLEHQELIGDNMLFHEQYNYCPNCGKKVKWDDSNNDN